MLLKFKYKICYVYLLRDFFSVIYVKQIMLNRNKNWYFLYYFYGRDVQERNENFFVMKMEHFLFFTKAPSDKIYLVLCLLHISCL